MKFLFGRFWTTQPRSPKGPTPPQRNELAGSVPAQLALRQKWPLRGLLANQGREKRQPTTTSLHCAVLCAAISTRIASITCSSATTKLHEAKQFTMALCRSNEAVTGLDTSKKNSVAPPKDTDRNLCVPPCTAPALPDTLDNAVQNAWAPP